MRNVRGIRPLWLLLAVWSAGAGWPRSAGAQPGAYAVHFTRDDHGGGNQTWDLVSDSAGRLFGANNSGLLVRDGASFRLFELPQRTSLRSAALDGNRVYTGTFEDIGYWEPDADGRYRYTSLNPQQAGIPLQNDEFWKIALHNGTVYFQSFGHILTWDGRTLRDLPLPGSVLLLFKAGGRLFIQQINGPLFEIRGSRFDEIPGTAILASTEVKSVLESKSGALIIGTSTKGLFLLENNRLRPWAEPAGAELARSQLNNGIRLPDGNLAFGTILNGIYVLNSSGQQIRHIHAAGGLQNNTVLALAADPSGNLWAGLDKGIDLIRLHAPVDTYRAPDEPIGAVYGAALFRGRLYVGTNQGIFSYTAGPDGRFQNRTFLDGSQGQTWFIQESGGSLYAGHNSGTFRIEANRMVPISSATGGFNFVPVSLSGKDYKLQGTYSSVALYGLENGQWTFSRTLAGITAPIRFLEVDHLGNILLGHTVKGLFAVQPSAGLDSLILLKKPGESDGLPPGTNRIVKVDNRILMPTGSELREWDPTRLAVRPYPELNAALGRFAAATAIIPAGIHKYWFLLRDEAALFEIRFGRVKQLYGLLPGAYGLHPVEGYERIVAINDSLHLFCLEDGFAVFNLQRINRRKDGQTAPILTQISVQDAGGSLRRLNPREEAQLPAEFNSIRFSVSAAAIDGEPPWFRYRLDGLDTAWSSWTNRPEQLYSRLPAGEYTFNVRTLNAKGLETDETTFRFQVRQPWFLSSYGFFIEGLFLLISIYAGRAAFKRRKWRTQEKQLMEENERIRLEKEHAEAALLKSKNDRLQFEMAAKNMELAKNTMQMVQKNETLIAIRAGLDDLKKELGYRLPAKRLEHILQQIDQNLEGGSDWEQFEYLFDQAHGGFFHRLKLTYPDLTASDLRLCAYLRLGLSSKEIAPLLNISIRGVEEKRYRLRKRLNLTADQGLSEFIVAF